MSSTGGDVERASLVWAVRRLRSTGYGKHVGRFSYYHVDLIAELPDVEEFLEATRQQFDAPYSDFNVIKLAPSRLSFLLYEHFSVPFPALLTALSCDITHGAARFTDYSRRHNPPILHRKELLLPADHALVSDAVQLTERLEGMGAFKRAATIGTRDGWQARLHSLGLTIEGGQLLSIA